MNEIYEILDNYEVRGIDLYSPAAISAIKDYLKDTPYNFSNIEVDEGGICAFSFIENQEPQLIMFEWRW